MAEKLSCSDLQWVVDVQVIEEGIFEGIKDSAGRETNLTGRILRTKWPSYGWAEFSNKVAALNIFSSAFSTKEMVKMKMGECGKEGDFFVWGNMTSPRHSNQMSQRSQVFQN